MAGFTLMSELVAAGKEFGIFEFYLPWIIMFAVFWALLTKLKLFGDPVKSKPAKAVNLIISLGASMYIMANTAIGISFATFLSALFGGAFMVVLTIIAFVGILYIVFRASMGKDPFDLKNPSKRWKYVAVFAAIGAIILVIGVYTSSAGTALFPGLVLPGLEVPDISTAIPGIGLPEITLSTQDLAIILLVVLTGAIVLYVTFSGKDFENALETR